MMSVIEFLSQPIWQRLGLTLVHFLWQGLLVAVLVGVLVRLFKLSPGNTRYAAYLLAFIVMMACPIVTFVAIDTSTEPVLALPVTEAKTSELSESISYPVVPADDIQPETDTFIPKTEIAAHTTDSAPLWDRISDYWHTSLPWALVAWMIGVLTLSMRLLLGFIGMYRWCHRLQPLPQNLVQRVALLSEGLSMRNFSRVFISPSALQAMAVGYLRPMVLLPAAMLTQMQPEMLEAIIAHELAHIRRFDLWVNLIQRVMETLLFYHPAVWWLSNRLRSERELCCDELAVKATGERLTYASALENAARARLFGKQPALAVGLGQSRRMLSRVRHILGFASPQQNSRFWLAGVITVLLLAALAIPTTVVLTSWSSGGSHESKSGLLRGLADPKVNAEGQRILKRMAEVNRYWLIGPASKVRNYSYNFNLYDRNSKQPEPKTIKVRRPTKVNSKWRQGITYDSVLHKLISNPSAAIIRKIQRNEQTIRLDFVFEDFIEVTCGNGISHTWVGYFTGLVKVGSLWLDATKMVPVKVKAGWQVEYFSEYVVVDEGHYVPLKITVGYEGRRYHWMFGFYDPGLWLFEKAHYGHDEKGQPRTVASTTNLEINKRSAVKTKTVVVEIPEFKEGREANDRKASKKKKSVTLTLAEQGMSFEGQTVTWDQFPSLLADVPEPENAGLEFVVAVDGLSSEKLNDVKTQISILSRELGLTYLSCIYDNVSTQEKSCEEHFFTASLEFSKDIYIRQNAIGEFKQKYYRSEKGWGIAKTEKHKEWATVWVNSIHFRKTWLSGAVLARLKVACDSWPRAKWQFTVRLLDGKGKSLAQESNEFDTGGDIISGQVLNMSSELDFSFGRWVDISKATTFEITVVPVPEDEAGLEPSLTQLGVKTDVQVEAGEFEVLSVKFRGFWIWWQKPQFKIKGDGSAEFSINKGPKDTTRYRTTFNLSKEHLRQLNELLKKTGWLTKPGANEEPKYTDASCIDITLVRKGEVKKVWCHDRNPEPYLSLVNFLKRIHWQEYLLNRMTAAGERERIDAFREINQELRAAKGDPVVAHPTPVLDYHRLVPVCKEVITHTDDNHRDVIVTALKLLGLLRIESERDTITKLTTAKQTSSKPEWSKSKTERVRSAAINSLVKFGGEESRQHLRKIAPNHRNFGHRVNDAIVAGLLELDGERSIELLKDMASTTRVAAWALIRLGPASVPAIVEILERPYNAHDSGPSNVIRAYIDHWDELPVLIDPRVVASVRRTMPVRSSWAEYRYHGRLLWLASLAHCKASRLEFRIAPVPAELGRPPGIADAGYRAEMTFLAANGPVSDPEFAGFVQWFELRTQAPELSYVGTYNGRKYALLCALPPHAMFADVEGPCTWGLKKVYATTDSEGRLAIGFELDENGAKLFAQLTKNNVGNHLAILVDGKVLSIVKVTSALPEKGVIAGSFAEEDIDNIVTALRKGMQLGVKTDVQVEGEGLAGNSEVTEQVLQGSYEISGTVYEPVPDSWWEDYFSQFEAIESEEEFDKFFKSSEPSPELAAAAGVVVTLRGDSITRETVTDAEGKYKFSGLPEGTYSVSCKKVVISTRTGRERKAIAKGEARFSSQFAISSQKVDLHLRDDQINVKGRITDAQGRPVGGAKITAIWGINDHEVANYWDNHDPPKWFAVSKDDGSYVVEGIERAKVNFYRIAGYLCSGRPYTYVDIRVEADGFVQNKNNIPKVTLVTEDVLYRARRFLKVASQISQRAGVDHPGVKEKERLSLPSINGNTITVVDIVLEQRPPSAHVSGRVLDTNGNPASCRVMELSVVNIELPPIPGVSPYVDGRICRIFTDENGVFDIPSIAPGKHSIILYGSVPNFGYMYQIPIQGSQLDIKPGERLEDFEIRVRPPEDYVISGRVRDVEGNPVKGLFVSTSIPHGFPWWDITDAAGAFCIEGLDGMGLSSFKVNFGHGGMAILDVPLNAKNVEFIVPDKGSIHGTVRNAKTGEAVTSYEVKVPVVNLSESGAVWEKPYVEIKRNPDDSFSISNVPAGEAIIEVSAEGLGVQRFVTMVETGKTNRLECKMPSPTIFEEQTNIDSKDFEVNIPNKTDDGGLDIVLEQTGTNVQVEGEIAWGEVVDGLQPGLGFDLQDRPYHQGELVSFKVYVRNTTNKTIKLVYFGLLRWGPTIFDSNGEIVSVWTPILGFPVQKQSLSLNPGETQSVGSVFLELKPRPDTRWDGKSVYPRCYLTPGTYSISQKYRFADYPGANWHGELTTGELELTILRKPPDVQVEAESGVDQNSVPERSFQVRGKITDENGNPMSGVEVIASCGWGSLMPTGRTLSRSDGSYTLECLPKNWLYGRPVRLQCAVVSTSKAGYYERNLCRDGFLGIAYEMPAIDDELAEQFVGIVLANKPYKLNFVMVPAAEIDGQVVDNQGKPIANFSFSMGGSELPPGAGVFRNLETDNKGRFAVSNVPLRPFWFIHDYKDTHAKTKTVTISEPRDYRVKLLYNKRLFRKPTLECIWFEPKQRLKKPAVQVEVESEAGGWQDIGQAIPPDFNDTMILTEHVNLDSIGQDAEGKVFVNLHRDREKTKEQQYRFILIKTNGTVVEPVGYDQFLIKEKLWEKFSFEYHHRDQIKEFRLQKFPQGLGQKASLPLAKPYDPNIDGKTMANATSGPPGRGALHFDGKGDYLYVPDSSSLWLGPTFTIEMWIKPEFPKEELENWPIWGLISKGCTIGMKGRVKSRGFGITLHRFKDDPNMLMIDYGTADDNGIYAKPYGRRDFDDWMHLYHIFSSDHYKPGHGYPLIVGRFLIPDSPFAGQIGEIRIWRGARSRDQISEYKNKPLTGDESGLAACWTFEQTGGQIAYDISPNRNHARLGNSIEVDEADPAWVNVTDISTQYTKPVKVTDDQVIASSALEPLGRHALSFDGVDDYLHVEANPTLTLKPPFTIEMWLKPDFSAIQQADSSKKQWRQLALMRKGKRLYDGETIQAGGFMMFVGPSSQQDSKCYGNLYLGNEDGLLYQVDRYGGERLQPTRPGWLYVSMSCTRETYIPVPEQPLLIGQNIVPSYFFPFKGDIAEIRIWSDVRSGYQVPWYRNKPLKGNESGLVACWDFKRAGGRIVYDISPNGNHARLGSSEGPDDADPKWVNLKAASHQPDQKPDVQVNDGSNAPISEASKENKKPPEQNEPTYDGRSLTELIAALGDQDFQTRIKAVYHLGYMGPKAKPAVPALVGALDEERLRESVLHSLGNIGVGAEEAIPALIKAIAEYAPACRWMAAESLAKIGNAAVPALKKAAGSEKIYLRIWCNAALAKQQGTDSPSLRYLAQLMKNADKRTAGEAVRALTMPGPISKPLVPDLIEALKHSVVPKKHIASALARIGKDAGPAVPELTKMLQDTDLGTRADAIYALSRIGGPDVAPAVPLLIQTLKTNDTSNTVMASRVRYTAATALGSVGPDARPAIPALVIALGDKDEFVRANSAKAIADIDPTDLQAVPALIEAMKDESGRVRVAAAQTLLKIGPVNKEVILAFIEAANDNWKGVITACETFFSLLGPQHSYVIPDLIGMLKTPNERAQQMAIRALGNMGEAAAPAVPYIIEGMKNSRLEGIASGTLRKLGPKGKAAVPELIKMLGDKHKRFSAALILEAIGPQAREAIPALEKCLGQSRFVLYARALLAINPKSEKAIQQLVRVAESAYVTDQWTEQPDAHYLLVKYGHEGNSNLQALIDALENPNSRIRLSAAAYLGKLGAEANEAAESLGRALKDNDPEVRAEAAHAILLISLKPSERKEACNILVDLLDGKDFASHDGLFMAQVRAAEALTSFGPLEEWTVPLLIVRVQDGSMRTRVAAIKAFGNIGPGAKEAIPYLKRLLKAEDWQIRHSAAQAIEKINNKTDVQVGVGDEETGTSSSRAWYILRQWNVGPLLLGLTQRLGKVITSSQGSDRVWTGMDQGGSLKLDIAVEGDVTGDIFIGFFKDSTWSAEPVQLRRFPQAGQYTIENLPPGKFQIGAMIGTLPVAAALGVHRTWPKPVEIKPGVTIEAEVLVSQDFQRRASGWYNQEVSRDFIGDWKGIDTDNLLQGRVTGPAGQPIPFAEILIREYNPGASGIMAPNRGTNELGYYKYDGMKWPYRVIARWTELLPYAFGYRYQQLSLNQVFEGPQMINFQFENFPPGTATVTGRVADQLGNPVQEFFLALGTWPEYSRKSKIPDGKYYNVVGYKIPFTANDGTFKLSGVPTGFFSIRAIPFKIQAYQLQRGQEATLEAGKTTNINLEVIAKNIFYGRIVFEDGSPAVVKPAPWPGAKTSIIMPMGRGGRAYGVANVDDDGYFAAYLDEREIEQLRSGNGSLIINVPFEQEGRRKSMGKFPFELLAKDKSKAGVFKIERPMGERPSQRENY